MAATKECEAVEGLISEDSPENYVETIDDLFEAWLCSNHSDGTTADQRSLKLTHTKALKRFLQTI